MDELKPCPFCGGTDIEIMHWTTAVKAGPHQIMYAAFCSNPDCGAFGPWDLGESGAVEAWNKRAEKEAANA